MPLVSNGALVGSLVSPRTAREFGLAANGANGAEMPESLAMAGGTLVVVADVVARTVVRPTELPLGAVTALVGVPFFLWRLRAGVAR